MDKESIDKAPLEVLYEDADMIAINKPHGLLVHRSPMARNAKKFAVQELRNQIDMHVYPCHRLDRKTAGILLFAKNQSSNQAIQKLFREGKIKKTYHAIVRGFIHESGMIDYTLKYNDKLQQASTFYKPLTRFEIPYYHDSFDTMRYTLVELKPFTGRFHQLRKHMAHIFHPIIGDRPHGCNKQNRIWKNEFNMDTMFLHAQSLSIPNYNDNLPLHIEAEYQTKFQNALDFLNEDGISGQS